MSDEMKDLLDTEQIAELLGLSRKHVTDRLTKAPNFPAPFLNISRKTRRWKRDAVMAWARAGQSSRAAMS
jgi:predicted DNA-binding transcriptional regulator AlpA